MSNENRQPPPPPPPAPAGGEEAGNTDPALPAGVLETVMKQVGQQVKDIMVNQTAEFLHLASEKAQKIVEDEKRKNTPQVLQQISEEVRAARKDASYTWNQRTNKSNYDALKQAEDLFAKSKAFMQLTEVKEDTESLKDSAISFHEGEKILKERLKLIKYADREGWKAAIYYEGDDLAENEADERRMKRSRKDADSDNRPLDRWPRDTRDEYSRPRTYTPRGRGGSRNTNTRQTQSAKFCTFCRTYGHVIRDCRRR